jgi:hypothetical protein
VQQRGVGVTDEESAVVDTFLLLASAQRVVLSSSGQDMNHEGNVDILWRHKAAGDNSVWIMTVLGNLTGTVVPGVQYYVYGRSPSGPYPRITPNPSPVGSYSGYPYSNQGCMVPGLQLVTSGSGTYTNISQGAFWP